MSKVALVTGGTRGIGAAISVALKNDDFYAWRCLEALGIDTTDGVVRASMVHYNTHEDVNKLISALKKI